MGDSFWAKAHICHFILGSKSRSRRLEDMWVCDSSGSLLPPQLFSRRVALLTFVSKGIGWKWQLDAGSTSWIRPMQGEACIFLEIHYISLWFFHERILSAVTPYDHFAPWGAERNFMWKVTTEITSCARHCLMPSATLRTLVLHKAKDVVGHSLHASSPGLWNARPPAWVKLSLRHY